MVAVMSFALARLSSPLFAATEEVFQEGFNCRAAVDCSGTATPVCCASVEVDSGTPPSCPQVVLEGNCTTAAACTTSLPSACPTTARVHLCGVSSECGDPSYPSCCEFPSGAGTATYCVDNFTALFANRCL